MRRLIISLIGLLLLICLLVPGVFAQWIYYTDPEPIQIAIQHSMVRITYPPFYITNIEITGGSYGNASFVKTDDTDAKAVITLNNNTSSTVVAEVTFYNGSDVSYYYNKTETISSSNNKITYEVSGISQKEEVPSKTYKTLNVIFKYSGSDTSSRSLTSELHFNFVIDKSSIGIVAAQTAVTRFGDVLNNVIFENSYQTLEDYMNNRGSNFSTVSYVGNVSGANDSDSKFMQELFTNEFLNMDLDGDGKSEPITIMIKREDLDDNAQTGDSYTYKGLLGNRTENGAEMTIYITSEGFSSSKLVVYAATFTKLQGSSEWIQIVPLTKGTATANNYNSGIFGTKNSFNTDSWESDNGKSMESLVKAAMSN